MSNVLIIGATSAMAEYCARHFAADGDTLLLTARDETKLAQVAEDLKVRGASEVTLLPSFDASVSDGMECLVDAIQNVDASLDTILVAHGHLPDQEACEEDVNATVVDMEINFTSTVRLCTVLGNRLLDQGHGTLAVISSVAGLRGRQSNYVYGAAKGGINIFLQGLRNRLAPEGIRVVTLLPGFVDTPMTADIEKGPLFVSAETAGGLIHKAITRGKLDVVYIPFFWRFILWVIRAIPEMVFKRLKL